MNEDKRKMGGKEKKRKPVSERVRQNLPIESELKSKRVYQSEPIDATCWAYMKLLRERDKTKKVYPINPYAEVYKFRENLYGILTESLDGMGDPWMYLIDGPEKALLVDTGFGIGNLKGLVDELTGGKELIVVNTHSHYDHAYGNAQFEKVYCHEYEAPLIEKQDENLWNYLFEEDTGRCIWTEFDRKDIVEFKPYELISCPDGYTFDLGGGHKVELIHMGGHTAGHAGYLDKRLRVFIAGDDIVSMRVGPGGNRPGYPHTEYATVSKLRECMEKLWMRSDEFDHVFTGHFVTDLENIVVKHMLDACNSILESPESNYVQKREGEMGVQYQKYVEGLGTIAYSMDSI